MPRVIQRIEDCPSRIPAYPFNEERVQRINSLLLQYGAEMQFPYMGRAEYEGAAIVDAANHLARRADSLEVITHELQVAGAPSVVHFVAPPRELERKYEAWQQWAKDPVTAEPSGFQVGSSFHEETSGWWDLQDNLLWMKTEDRAEKLRSAFVNALRTAEKAESERASRAES